MDMFDLPQAKRVRRNELNSDSSSQASSDDNDATTFLRALDTHFAIDNAQERPHARSEDHGDTNTESQRMDKDEEEQETHAFRLFTNAASITLPTSQELGQSNTALANKLRRIHRPENYWRADPSESQKRDIKRVALSGDDVKRLASVRWPGCEVKWRVSVWPASANKGVSAGTPHEENEKKRRCRKSKKTRIKLRRKREQVAQQARQKQEEAQRAVEQAKEKEEYMRQKKTAMNRKKQLKKREKERERKRIEDDCNDEES